MKPNSIYSMLIELSRTHERFGRSKGYRDLLKFDLKKKRIWNGSTVIVDNGNVVIDELCGYTELKSVPLMTNEEAEQSLEELYRQYRVSVPNKHSGFSECNFKALTPDEMTIKQLANGIPRATARYMLEAFVMFKDLTGLFEKPSHFYWQSKVEPDLIVFREWA